LQGKTPCPPAAYYRLAGNMVGTVADTTSFDIDGHETHEIARK